MPNKIKIMYNAQGLVPAIVQDRETKQVLMLAWMNQESLKLTIKTRLAHFWSRSRQTLWKKGETSGNLLKVHEIWVDCDADTLLLTVDPAGPACHTGHITCFYRQLEKSNV
jgi:phosphoribosyl-AMP cyclohydrolase